MLIIGLTGSMGMGKSHVARHFLAKGIPVFDADKAVHDLYSGPEAQLIEGIFPGSVVEGVVDRGRLSKMIQESENGIQKLEALVHPLIRQKEKDFLLDARKQAHQMAVLEVPLLLETGMRDLIDICIVVSAPAEIQKARVMKRPGMTEEKFTSLLKRQMPDAQKRELADYIVDTSGEKSSTLDRVDQIIESLKGKTGTAINKWM